MKIAISNLPYQGLSIGPMQHLPKDLGVEIFAECGIEYYWEHWLPLILKGRTGEFSVHAPFQHVDLSDPQADFEQLRTMYRWTFELCEQFGAKHCTCHPYEGPRPDDDTPQRKERAKQCSLERVVILDQDARDHGVQLLVENMPQKHGLLNQEEFIGLFAPHQQLNFLIDTGHANLQAWDMELAFQQLGSRIHAYHVNDNLGDMDSHLHAWEGTFDWKGFFAGCTRYTPDATLVCEYNEGPLEKILASVDRIRKEIQPQIEKI